MIYLQSVPQKVSDMFRAGGIGTDVRCCQARIELGIIIYARIRVK